MLMSSKVILYKDTHVLGFIKEMTIKCSSDNLCIYAETVDINNARKSYFVEKMTSIRDCIHIDLKEIDYTPSISENEKIIPIDFKSKKLR